MTAKPAVVRIISGYAGVWVWRNRQWQTQSVGSGSGFIINPNGYILTNAHVVDSVKQGDEAGKQTLLFELAAQALQSVGLQANRANMQEAVRILGQEAQLAQFNRINYVFLQSGKRFPYEIKSFGAPVGEGKDLIVGKDVAVIKVEIKNAPTLRLGNSENVQVGDAVWVIGYPAAADSEALDEKSALEPTTNDGKVSAKKNSADGAPILQTSVNTTHGNSGGPAINEKGEVIGLLTFRGNTVNGQEVQGFNFIVPVNTAAEFVRQAGTDNQASAIDAKWAEGLNHFWRQEYSKAKKSFQDVTAMFSDHAEAQRLITESQEHIANGEDKPGLEFEVNGWKAAMIIAAIFLIPAAGLAGLVFFIRKRKATFTAPSFAHQPGFNPANAFAPAWRLAMATRVTQPGFKQTAPFARPAKTETLTASPNATAKLIFLSGPLQGQQFPVGKGLFIGRAPGRSHIIILDQQISGQHLWVGPVNGHFVARDCNSTNGSYINGRMEQRIAEVELNDGDVLTLGVMGTVKLVFKS
jgi:V8-like Glu-specific endopeptidase